MANKSKDKYLARKKRQRRVRKKVVGTTARPRLCVFRSSKHIYVQVIDDAKGITLAAAGSIEKDLGLEDDATKRDSAARVGQLIAERCKEKNIENVVFDRNGYRYQSGRILALAGGARDGGLNF